MSIMIADRVSLETLLGSGLGAVQESGYPSKKVQYF